MDKTIIYSKTAKGITELKNGAKTLSKEQGRALTMVNGKSTVGEFMSALNTYDQQKTVATLAELEHLGLVRVFANSAPPAVQSGAAPVGMPFNEGIAFSTDLPTLEVTELSGEQSVQEWADAKRGARSLQEKGFYSYSSNPGTEARPEKKNLSVLVVEDDEAIAQVLELLLANRGFTVSKAADIPSAIAHLKNSPLPDLVLLDVVLPGSAGHDGFHVLRLIRQTATMRTLPVIMVTSQISDEQVLRGLKAGADGYIFKPFKWDALYSCIKSVVGI